MQGLYAIVDTDFLDGKGIAIVSFAEQVLLARPPLLQLRAKHESAPRVVSLLRALREPCTRAGTLLFANDRPDLAVTAGCDGVHVGQDDLAVADVRRFAPHLRVGVSTHDAEQLARALADRPDYVAFGPVFATSSKERPDPVVGLDGLAAAHDACRASGIPLVAIGGIDVARVSDVAVRTDVAAVISALWPEDGLAGVTRRAESLHRALCSRP